MVLTTAVDARSIIEKKKNRMNNVVTVRSKKNTNTDESTTTTTNNNNNNNGNHNTLNRRRAVSLAGLLLTTARSSSTSTEEAKANEGALNVGDDCIDFELPKTGGGSFKLSTELKKNAYVVVYFYNQDGSTGCSIEAERFNQAQEQFQKKNARVVGISMDSIESHEGFCDKKGLTFTLLSDRDGSVSKSYGAELNLPVFGKFSDRQTFVISAKDSKIIAHWKESGAKNEGEKMLSVKSTAHVDQVLSVL
jgi:thioredoxin-dependent peroxiredoxin